MAPTGVGILRRAGPPRMRPPCTPALAVEVALR